LNPTFAIINRSLAAATTALRSPKSSNNHFALNSPR